MDKHQCCLIVTAILVIITLVPKVVNCQNVNCASAPNGNENWITYGAVYSLTGGTFVSVKCAVDFFVSYANENFVILINNTRYYVRVLWFDDGGATASTPILYEALMAFNDVDFLIGPASSGIQPISQVAAAQSKLLFSTSAPFLLSQSGVNYNSAYTFSMQGNIADQENTCAEFFSQKLGIKTMLLTTCTGHYQFLAPQFASFNKSGINCIIDIFTSLEDFIEKIPYYKTLNADMIWGGLPNQEAQYSSALRLANWETGIGFGKSTLNPFGWAMQNTYSPSYWASTLNFGDEYFANSTFFANEFTKFTNTTPYYSHAATVASLLLVMKAAIATQSIELEVVKAYLINTTITTFYGVSNFNNPLHVAGQPLCVQYQGPNGLVQEVADGVGEYYPVATGIPLEPDYLKPKDNTGFLLAVTLGTILPGLLIIAVVIVVIAVMIFKFDVIVLPKQSQDWDV